MVDEHASDAHDDRALTKGERRHPSGGRGSVSAVTSMLIKQHVPVTGARVLSWDAVERESHLTRAAIAEAAQTYASANAVIGIYGMGLTQRRVAPSSAGLKALTNAPVDLDDRPDALRAAVVAFFASNTAEREVRASCAPTSTRCRSRTRASRGPRTRAVHHGGADRRQAAERVSTARAAAVDDGLSFSPWHGIAAHRPLGSVMRARKQAYEMSKRFQPSATASLAASLRRTLRFRDGDGRDARRSARKSQYSAAPTLRNAADDQPLPRLIGPSPFDDLVDGAQAPDAESAGGALCVRSQAQVHSTDRDARRRHRLAHGRHHDCASVRQFGPASHDEMTASDEGGTIATDLKKGDTVEWKSSQGTIKGEVEKKVTSPIEIKGHHVTASNDDPQYLVKSDKTGAEAAHKPGSLEKSDRPDAAEGQHEGER